MEGNDMEKTVNTPVVRICKFDAVNFSFSLLFDSEVYWFNWNATINLQDRLVLLSGFLNANIYLYLA